MGTWFVCLALVVCGCGGGSKAPDSALKRLMDGNLRYVQGRSIHPDEGEKRRSATYVKQEPFAIIVGCSDSRVPPEIVFDQGLGDVFVIRVAGNIVGPLEKNSIEFAAKHLRAPLIMVLGHEKCGAVDAVLAGKAKEYDIEEIEPFIEPAIVQARKLPGDRLTNCIQQNVRRVVAELKATPILIKLIEDHDLKIVGGYYELANGKVLLLDEEK
jgi:carbonic anhydrase